MTADKADRRSARDLRASIDNIDAALVHMLAERFQLHQAGRRLQGGAQSAAGRSGAREGPDRAPAPARRGRRSRPRLRREVLRIHRQGSDPPSRGAALVTAAKQHPRSEHRDVPEDPPCPRRRQEAPVLPHRHRRRALSARRPLHRDRRHLRTDAAQGRREARRCSNVERIQHWLSVGAQPTDRVLRFLDAAGLAKRAAAQQPGEGRARQEGAGARCAARRRAAAKAEGAPAETPAAAAELACADRRLKREASGGDDRDPARRRRPHRRRARHQGRGAGQVLHRRARWRLPPTARSRPRTAAASTIVSGAAGRRRPPDMLVVRFQGRRRPQRGRGAERRRALGAARAAAASRRADEFYHADLIGLAAVTPDGAPLGTVVAVPQLRRRRPPRDRADAGRPTLLVPFTRAVVPEIDLAAGRVVVDPPPVEAER